VEVPAPQPVEPPAAPRVEEPPRPQAEPPVTTAPLPVPPAEPQPVVPKAPAPAMTLLLPLDAPDFRPAAEALQQGFMAAMTAESRKLDVVVRRSDASDERTLAAYKEASEDGTRVIIGPMTRSAVAALIRDGRIAVPTLALNQPEARVAVPRPLYVFSLGADTEARLIARDAWADTMRIAAVISTAAAVDRRSRDAFVDEWLLLGGRITDTVEVTTSVDPAQLRELLDRNPPHFVFLAAGGDRARWLRPFLGQMQVYATSQVNTVEDPLKNLDLNGVRFADMPWLVRPRDPLVTRYPRPPGLEGDMARFYALGIDAYRIAVRLLNGERAFQLNGVTGHISVLETGAVERRPVAAMCRDGKCVALE
jgi:uncharacterized protein